MIINKGVSSDKHTTIHKHVPFNKYTTMYKYVPNNKSGTIVPDNKSRDTVLTNTKIEPTVKSIVKHNTTSKVKPTAISNITSVKTKTNVTPMVKSKVTPMVKTKVIPTVKPSVLSKIFSDLLNIDRIKSDTPDLDKLKVDLVRHDVKGTSLVATKKIKKGEIIAFYKFTVFDHEKYDSPTNYMYTFNVYRKDGKEIKPYIGDIDIHSFPKPLKNIPFWAAFANEPSPGEESNADIDTNLKGNYSHRSRVRVGSCMIYNLVATKNINEGDEILWYYGESYIRDYEAQPD